MNRSQKAMNALVALDTAGVAPVITTGQDLREVLEALATIQDRDDQPDPEDPVEDLGPKADAIIRMADTLVEIVNLIGSATVEERKTRAPGILASISAAAAEAGLTAPDSNPKTYTSRVRMAHYGRTGRLIDL